MSGFLIITSFQDHFYETVTVLNQRINAGITNVTCELRCEKSSAGEGNSPTGEINIFGWATHMHGNWNHINPRSWLAAAGRMTPEIRYNEAAWHNDIFSLNGLGSPYRQFLSERQWIVTAH